VIRQAHPGELRGTYRTYEDKLESAREYKRLESIEWPVLVDDYEGTVHRTYSEEMADPTFLIDADGRIAFYCMWTHAPTLKTPIDELLAKNGRGAPVAGGIDRIPHLFANFVDGIRGPKRGGKQAVREYSTGGFGAGLVAKAGNRAKPLLAPIALRATPLPVAARIALALGLLALLAVLVWLVTLVL
jgi:hypothetical protein